MGREMPESAIVLFTLIDTLIFLFFYANVHLIRVITHSSLETIPVFQHVPGDEGGIHGPATVSDRLVASQAVSVVDANDRKEEVRKQEAGMTECLLVWTSSIMDRVTLPNDSDL